MHLTKFILFDILTNKCTSKRKVILKISGTVWLDEVVDKLDWKHHVTISEVEEVLSGKPKIYFNLNYSLAKIP